MRTYDARSRIEGILDSHERKWVPNIFQEPNIEVLFSILESEKTKSIVLKARSTILGNLGILGIFQNYQSSKQISSINL